MRVKFRPVYSIMEKNMFTSVTPWRKNGEKEEAKQISTSDADKSHKKTQTNMKYV